LPQNIFDLGVTTKSTIAKPALDQITQLYAIEPGAMSKGSLPACAEE
jgi:hypothetical protein